VAFYVAPVLHRLEPHFVGRPDDMSALNAAAREPYDHAPLVLVSAGIRREKSLVIVGSTAEFAAPND
jgi:hypothetical protein